MSAQIKYANGVFVNYSLTTYSPYEGWQIAFNGVNGRLETWEDIPYLQTTNDNQENKHITEMSINKDASVDGYREIFAMNNFEKSHEIYRVPKIKTGHGGGDVRMLKRLFVDTHDNPNHVMAGTREGAMSILIGIAARKSIQLKRPVKIKELTNLKPMAIRFD
jgi:hypothetical protein